MFDLDADPLAHLAHGQDDLSEKVTTPGQLITSDTAFMRGHGTYLVGDKVISSVAGTVERTNKLVTVKSSWSRYAPEIGDTIVGRITEVGPKRWKVDIGSRQDAVLMLSSINLPGGVQRRKSESDELAMRTFFAEGDLVVAEVQAFFGDGAVSLHTRSLRYGKLRNGSLVSVRPHLMQRLKSHFHSLPFGVDVILGLNGYIWISQHSTTALENIDPMQIYSNENEKITATARENIARVYNCIGALSRYEILINDSVINLAYEASLEWNNISDLQDEKVMAHIARSAVGE